MRVKNMEEGYEGGHGGGGHERGHEGGHVEGGNNIRNHINIDHNPHAMGYSKPIHRPISYDHSSYYGYYPVYSNYEYPIYYVNDDDDYIFDENGILYYIYNPHLIWKKLFG